MYETVLLVGILTLFNPNPFAMPELYLAPAVTHHEAVESNTATYSSSISTATPSINIEEAGSDEEDNQHICSVFTEELWDAENNYWYWTCVECGETMFWADWEDDSDEDETDHEECVWSYNEDGFYYCEFCNMKAYIDEDNVTDSEDSADVEE